ncbi:ADP-ribosylglycohydrolase [Anaeromyces robustus]|uniref:ADP-ribosylhydrolase ARH3 n=1 Tax=Anaeromyces robustus TaxID=1754192 RepID=A0A1Y1X1Y8_9FUNG|nr:ADP-ribosylglycohydrolase [Anaeromyces robustus]|eukprot:ORX79819.1 ADP-ribosylglycohydrolase [Anaeromyces robustus]
MDRIKSALYGFVVGDALGVPVEFNNRNILDLSPVTDMTGYGSHHVPEGVWSDDTAMTLATMDSIIKTKTINYNDIADKFCSWLYEKKYTATNVVFDVGITTNEALNRYKQQKLQYNNNNGNNNSNNNNIIDATICGGKNEMNNGNGSLMRILPIAFYCYYQSIDDENKILEFVKNVSSITHGHEISIMGCYIYVQYIINLLKGKNKYESYTFIQNLDYSMFQNQTQMVYERLLKNNIVNYERDNIQSSGYVVSTLEASLWCLLKGNNLKDTILTAVNLGNDTDTVGAITGSLAGMIYNYEDIPKNWIEKLKNKELLNDLIKKFSDFCLNIN